MLDVDSKKTVLHGLHLDIGAKMVDFAGYHMPLQYTNGIKQEHLHCRDAAGLFDVSHMGQFLVQGEGAIAELEKLLPVDLEQLADHEQVYTLLINDVGGICDDLIISRRSPECFFIVVNAACKDQDIAYFRQHLPSTIQLDVLDQHALIALQGPKAREVMQKLCPQAAGLTFMHGCDASCCDTSLFGEDCYISCSGYTGEDGFEISLPSANAEKFARALLDYEQVQAIGLAARDSLRLEAGLCLYGHDMDQDTTPVEASLVWSINRSRRAEGQKRGGFPGAEVILQKIEQGVARKRVGLQIDGRVPVREGAFLQDIQGNVIGQVSSGGLTPTVGKPIAMGYVSRDFSTIGEQLQAIVRNKAYPASVVKMPFVPQRYYRG